MKEELKCAFLSRGFVLAVVIMLLCFFGQSLPEWLVSSDWGAAYRPTALSLAIGGIFFGGVMLLLPFCAGMPHAISQVDELQTSFLCWKIIRGSMRRYAANKIIATALSGAAALALPFIIHTVIWHTIAQPLDLAVNPYHEIPFAPECVYSHWYDKLYGLPMFISMAIGLAISGALWAVAALTTAVWIPDKLLSLAVPVCIYYLWMAGLPRVLFHISIPSPSALYNDGLTWSLVGQSLLTYGAVMLIAITLYIVGLKRRSQHA